MTCPSTGCPVHTTGARVFRGADCGPCHISWENPCRTSQSRLWSPFHIPCTNPYRAPTNQPTNQPTDRPTDQPTNRPTDQPTRTNAGGPYSHSIMIDYPRIPIPETHLGFFLTIEFQSWRVNFKNEVCRGTADPQITVHWFKETEIAKLIDELVTSRSMVERTHFLDFDMLDAMVASALKKLLNTQIDF